LQYRKEVHCCGSKWLKVEEEKQNLINANSIQKPFSGPVTKNYKRKFLRRKTGVPVMCETIKYKAWELATSHNVQHHFMASRL